MSEFYPDEDEFYAGESFEDDDFPMYLEYTDWLDDLPGASDIL